MTISNEGSEKTQGTRAADALPPEPVTLRAADGYALRGHVWRHRGGSVVRPVTVINCATSVRCDYYFRFAVWLFAQGRDVLVYDYRGIGGSRPARLAKLRANWLDWGGSIAKPRCATHATRFRASRSTSSRTASAGSRSTAASNVHVRHAVTVGAQYAYWRDYRPAERRRMWWKWHVVMPVLAAVFGYVPAKRLGWMEDTPRGVALSWVRSQARFEEGYTSGRSPNPPRAAPRCPPVSRDCRRRCSRLASTTTGSARSRRSSGWSATTRAATSRICGSRRPTSASTRSAISRFSTTASPKHCGRSRSTGCNTARCQPMRRATCMRFIRHRAGVEARQRRAGRCRERAIGRPRHAWHMPRGHAPALGIDAGGPQRFAISPDRLTSDVSFHRPPHVDARPARFRFPV